MPKLSPISWMLALALIFWGGSLGSPALKAQEDQESSPTSAVTTPEPLSFLFDGQSPTSIEQLREMEQRFATLTEKLFPATVNIQLGSSQGSGVVVTSDGYILTAAHVIGGPDEVAQIRFPDGSRYEADTLGVSPGPIDSGMLKIRNPDNKTFPYIELGISEETKEGQWVMAVGHPGGINESRGLVARVGRIVSKSEQVLVTDCTLVGGDSGGPLIDMNGSLIGIHSRIGSSLANNLHVPVDQYSDNWDKLAEGLILSGRPSLGFDVVDATNEILSVREGKPAAEAGLQPGDVIIQIDGAPITNRDDIGAAIKTLLPNQKIDVVVLRNEEEKKFRVKVGQR